MDLQRLGVHKSLSTFQIQKPPPLLSTLEVGWGIFGDLSECELWEGDVTVFNKDSRDWYTAVLLCSLLKHGFNEGEHSKSKIPQSSNAEVQSKFNC